MKYLVLALVAAVSFTAGHYLLPRKVGITHTMVEKCEELLQFRPDFEAYQKLKTADERYRKADEILGKIMTVFLADLGLRATMPVAAVPSSNSQVAASQSDHREANQPPAASPETVAETPVKKEASGREWIRYENQIKELVSENEVKDTLKKMEIKDLFSELKNAGTLSASQVQSVIGKYVGEITFFDNSHVWAVEWSLDARLRNDGRLVGKQDISLSGKREALQSFHRRRQCLHVHARQPRNFSKRLRQRWFSSTV